MTEVLRGWGVRRSEAVGVVACRSVDACIALLAILGAGAVPVPVSENAAPRRAADQCSLARVSLLLVPESATPPAVGIRTEPVPAVKGSGSFAPVLDGMTAALFLQTSGTTGAPRMVQLTQAGLLDRLKWGQQRYPLCHEDTVLNSAELTFDFAIWELFAAWSVAARLAVLPSGMEADPVETCKFLRHHRVTVAHFVPTIWTRLLSADRDACSDLRLVFSGGEPLPAQTATAILERTSARLFNQYGPCETSIDVSCAEIRLPVPPVVPIGHVADVGSVLLFADGERLAPRRRGELAVTGIALADGYVNDARGTAKRFRPHPWSPGARVFRTGDVVEVSPDGAITFVGRSDGIVKISGVRVDTAEVEAVARELPGVRGALAVAYGASPAIALFVLGTPEEADLRTLLASSLVPAAFPGLISIVGEFPTLPNGKADRIAAAALAQAIDKARTVDRETGEEKGALGGFSGIHALVASVWSQVLGLSIANRKDDFFELGGQSLQATQVSSRLGRRLGFRVPVRLLFEHRSLHELAEILEELVERNNKGLLDELILETYP